MLEFQSCSQLGKFVFGPQIMAICHHQARKHTFPMILAEVFVVKGKQVKITAPNYNFGEIIHIFESNT